MGIVRAHVSAFGRLRTETWAPGNDRGRFLFDYALGRPCGDDN